MGLKCQKVSFSGKTSSREKLFTRRSGSVSWTSRCHMTGLELQTHIDLHKPEERRQCNMNRSDVTRIHTSMIKTTRALVLLKLKQK